MLHIDLKFGLGKNDLEFSKKYKTLISESSQLLIQAIEHPDFEKRITTYNWKPRLRKRKYRFNHTSTSRKDVFKKIISGDDNFSNELPNDSNVKGDKDIDIYIIPYYDKKHPNVIGKTNKTTYFTWLNLAHWDNKIKSCKKPYYEYELLKIALAVNIIHEYCHNLGFKHKGNKRNRNNNRHSVPYAVGDIVKNILLNNLKEKKEKLEKEVTDYVYVKSIESACEFDKFETTA